MIKNRSVPADVVLPHITYENVGLALDWLTKTFGFVEHYRYGEPDAPQGAQMHLGDAWIMLNSARPGSASPAQVSGHTQSLTVFVEDVDAHFNMAVAAGAKIVEDLNETAYGERHPILGRVSQNRSFRRRTERLGMDYRIIPTPATDAWRTSLLMMYI